MIDDEQEAPVRKSVWIAIAVLIVLLSVGAFFNSTRKGVAGGQSRAGEAAPPIRVTAPELFSAYISNRDAAEQRYGNRRVEITGQVTSIDLDSAHQPVVSLKTAFEYQEVQTSIVEASKGRVRGLSEGQSVSLSCAGVYVIMGQPLLNDCNLRAALPPIGAQTKR